MTKKHFIAFAARINSFVVLGELNTARAMAGMVIDIAAADNANFDKARFLAACGLS